MPPEHRNFNQVRTTPRKHMAHWYGSEPGAKAKHLATRYQPTKAQQSGEHDSMRRLARRTYSNNNKTNNARATIQQRRHHIACTVEAIVRYLVMRAPGGMRAPGSSLLQLLMMTAMSHATDARAHGQVKHRRHVGINITTQRNPVRPRGVM